MVVEALAQSLEECLKIAEARGSAAPTTLCVVGDNTVKELKNSYCLSYLANLCLQKKMQRL